MIELDLLELFQQTQSWALVILSAAITVITCFGGIWFSHILSKQKTSKIAKAAEKNLKTATKRNEKIVKTLRRVLQEFECDRAYVYEFHNGTFYSSGLPMEKFSCTYEAVREGISSESQKHIEYKMSNYSEYIYKIVHQGLVKIDDIDVYGFRENDCPLFKNLMKSKGVKSIINVALKNPYDQTVGFLGIDFVSNKKTLSNEQLNVLQNFARTLIGYVEMEK